jgi:hypothetical protein
MTSEIAVRRAQLQLLQLDTPHEIKLARRPPRPKRLGLDGTGELGRRFGRKANDANKSSRVETEQTIIVEQGGLAVDGPYARPPFSCRPEVLAAVAASVAPVHDLWEKGL